MGRSRQQESSGPHPHIVGDGKKGANLNIEILTGSDALHFLCSNSEGDRQQAYINPFSKPYSEMNARESPITYTRISSARRLLQSPPTTSLLSPTRKQRKAYKPSRVPPLEEVPMQPTLDKSVVTDDLTALNCPTTQGDETFNKKKSGISSKTSFRIGDSQEDLSMVKTVKGKRNKRQNLHSGATVVCKNLACKAVLHAGASFCRRCSCCICKEFDDNKDPSLWIICDADEQDGCGLSCHVECALQNGVAGVVRKGSSVSLDGSFLCRSCGRVSSLLGLWKRQLMVAKNARRVDVLCHRLLLSHRLLKGTVKYKYAHTPIDNAIKLLEAEVRLMNKDYAKLERCIVNRLSCNTEVQKLIDLALGWVESFCDAQSMIVSAKNEATQDKAFCTMRFEDVCSSSIVVVAVDTYPCDDRLGYKLWHRKATDPTYPAAPTYTIQSTSKKVVVLDLQPHTSYAFKMAPFSKGGDGEECEAECCTEGMELTEVENHVNDDISGCLHGVGHPSHNETIVTQDSRPHSSPLSQSIQNGRAEEQGGAMEELSNAKVPSRLEAHEGKDNHSIEEPGHVLNEMQMSPRKDVCETTELPRVTTPRGDVENEKEEVFLIRDAFDSSSPTKAKTANVDIMGNSNMDSQSWYVQLHCNNGTETGMLSTGELASAGRDGTSHASDFHNLEFPMRVIRWLERLGHLDKEFRMKFLTWYSLRAMEHEKRVVNVFIDTLQDSPASLAAQLVDAFQDVIISKRQRLTEVG